MEHIVYMELLAQRRRRAKRQARLWIYLFPRPLSGLGAPSDSYLTRIVTAVRFQKRLNIPIPVSGVGASKYRVAEYHIVKRFLTDLGVPAEEIIIEAKNRDTFENEKLRRKFM